MFEPMGAGIHGVEAAEVNGKTVLVSGCGPIGLTAISARQSQQDLICLMMKLIRLLKRLLSLRHRIRREKKLSMQEIGRASCRERV